MRTKRPGRSPANQSSRSHGAAQAQVSCLIEPMISKYDVAIVGAGIVGLAHAWMAARRGLSVCVFDRSSEAAGATVRNFGMVWPIGQPRGERLDIAIRSRELWLELGTQRVLNARPCGSVHVAHHDDEMAILEEFAATGSHACRIATPDEIRRAAPIVNAENLRGGLISETELSVNPRVAARRIAGWLAEEHGVCTRFNTPIVNIDRERLEAADGTVFEAGQIVVCSGSDLRTLLPSVLQESGLRLCKLQMLKTVRQPGVGAHAHIASGLTLRHYTSFESCGSLPALRKRIADESPELDQYGIHVMAARAEDGGFILGDSHEYGTDIAPFDKAEIDRLILRELRKIICLPDWTIAERWHGVYAKHPDRMVVSSQPAPGIRVCVGPGGAGMTMSFGLAEHLWNQWN